MFCIHCYWYSTVFWYSLNYFIYCSSLSQCYRVFPHRPRCVLFRCIKSCTVVVVTGHSICTLPKRQMKLYADAGRNMCMCVCLHKPVCLCACEYGVLVFICFFVDLTATAALVLCLAVFSFPIGFCSCCLLWVLGMARALSVDSVVKAFAL